MAERKQSEDQVEGIDKFDVRYKGFSAVFDKRIEKALGPVGYIRTGSGYYFPKNERDMRFERER